MEHGEQAKTSVTWVFSAQDAKYRTLTLTTITWRKVVEVVLLANSGQADQNNKSKEEGKLSLNSLAQVLFFEEGVASDKSVDGVLSGWRHGKGPRHNAFQ